MQAQAWSIPFPRKERAGKKKPAHKRSGRRPAAAPATAAGTRRPLPPWNSSTTDLDKHKLTAAELSFRKSLRQSRHRQHSWADHSQQQAEAAAAVEAGCGFSEAVVWPGDCRGWLSHGGDAGETEKDATEQTSSAAPDTDNDGGGSLAGMQEFVAELQRRYGLHCISPSPAPAPLAAQRKLAELQALAAAAPASEGEDGLSDSGTGSQSCRSSFLHLQGALRRQQHCPVAAGRLVAPVQEPSAEGTSDSEGEGHLGPAAARRAWQRQAAAAAAREAAGTACPATQRDAAARRQPLPLSAEQQSELEARLAAAEGQLARLAGVKVQLLETRAEVARLREQNEQLQTDLDDFVSHTSTLLTSLQTQLSGFLAAGASPTAGADAAAPQHAQQVIMPRPTAAAAAGAAVLQARAAAEALSISQQGHTPAACSSACASGGEETLQTATATPPHAGSSSQAGGKDALASLQLPAFRGLAQLQPAAAKADCVAGPSLQPPVIPPLPTLHAGQAVGSLQRHAGENSPPQQRDAARLPTPTPSGKGTTGQG